MKNKLVIFDFDGTIYYNPENNWSSDIQKDNIVYAGKGFYSELNLNYLITGRKEITNKTKELLLLNGYLRFEEIICSSLPILQLTTEQFYKAYYNWKFIEIINVIEKNGGYSELDGIYILDDDINILKKFDYIKRKWKIYPIQIVLKKRANNIYIFGLSW